MIIYMPTLQELWTDTFCIGYNVRKNRDDGLQSWQPLKEKYSRYQLDDDKLISIKDLPAVTYIVDSEDHDNNNVTMTINGTTLQNTNEVHHFFIQHFRIPRMGNNKLSILKVLQIAYNAGQFACERGKRTYKDDLIAFYVTNKLGDITAYVDNDIAMAEVVALVKGGGYGDKYHKYKQKYLTLKRGL